MSKWEENEYVIESKRDVREAKEEMAKAQEIFSNHIEQVAAIHPTLASWAKAGYESDMYWDEQSINNNMEWLADSKRAYENRVKGAKKAAETRKLNKLKLA
jgi:hypothetical protein